MDLFVKKDGICLDNNSLVVMFVLNYLQSDKHDFIYVDISQMGYIITGHFVQSSGKDKCLCNNIKKGLDTLIDKKLVKVMLRDKDELKDKDKYIIDWKNSSIKVDTKNDNFVAISLFELQTIFNEAVNRNYQPFKLLRFFVDILGTVNNKTKEWHYSQDTMIELFGGSKSTINDYLKQLEELKLLYVYRPNMRKIDGTYYNVNNSYGRFADKEKIITAAQSYIVTIECELINSSIDRRSISLQYRAFKNGSKKYKDNPELIISLYEDCVKYNKSLKSNPIHDNDLKAVSDLDLSVFDGYVTLKDSDERKLA